MQIATCLKLLMVWGAVFVSAAFSKAQVQAQEAEGLHEFDSAVLQVVETIEVPAAAMGPLKDLKVKNGGMIKADEILATIADSDIQIQLRESQIEFEMIKAQAESNVDVNFALKSRAVAVADLRRAEQSNKRYAGVVSDREMDRLKLLVEQSSAELEKTRFDKTILKMQQKLRAAVVERNENELKRHQLRSKISGQVVEIHKHPGEWVNVADPVLKVVRLDRLRVERYLPAKFATGDLLDSAARFSPVGSNEKFFGKVVFVNPEINPLNATVQVWIEFENQELDLRPGMKGSVVIIKNSTKKKSTVSTLHQ